MATCLKYNLLKVTSHLYLKVGQNVVGYGGLAAHYEATQQLKPHIESHNNCVSVST